MRNYLMFSLFALSFILSVNTSLQAQEYGSASYYSDKFQGRKTASGELYDKNKLTGAHKSLKFGTIVLVTRLDNKKSVKIRINDRGPYIKGRIVDVSRTAAEKLGLVIDGHAEVKLEIIGEGETDKPIVSKPPPSPNNQPNLADLKVKEPKKVDEEKIPSSFSEKSVGLPDDSPKIVKTVEEVNTKPVKKPVPDLKVPAKNTTAKKAPASKKSVAAPVSYSKVKGSDFQTYDLYRIQLERPSRAGFGVQIASLTQYESVMKQVAQLQEKWFNNVLVSVEKGADGKPIYKLILGPFDDRATAESYKKELKNNKKMDGFVVDLSVSE